uniref:Uncharacterized protein n=1 Tax=Cucumis melo TaxID=3656 RepID=A0A9I9DUB1_CUCME
MISGRSSAVEPLHKSRAIDLTTVEGGEATKLTTVEGVETGTRVESRRQVQGHGGSHELAVVDRLGAIRRTTMDGDGATRHAIMDKVEAA